jgi:hypothetical protein
VLHSGIMGSMKVILDGGKNKRSRSILTSSHLCLDHLCGLFPSDLQIKFLYQFLISPVHASCHAHLILLDLIIVIVFGEEY